MFSRKTLVAVALAVATLAPVTSFARESEPRPTASAACPFVGHHLSVAPYYVEETHIKTTTKRLAGARITVEAEPGLTAEWLRLQIGRHLNTMGNSSSMRPCPLHADDVRFDVQSEGTGFTVKLIAVDPKKADDVLREARALAG
jgi:hypothetical protein